ncbi:hypothetical protein DFH06DRAFT_991398, partial [Mycena polygramma]
TSCYIFLAAHHANAKEPFLHYTSPRLVRDAKSQMEEVTNTFNTMFIDLKTARHKDATELTRKLRIVENQQASTSRDLVAATQDLEDARTNAAEQQKKIDEQEELLNRYKALLAK